MLELKGVITKPEKRRRPKNTQGKDMKKEIRTAIAAAFTYRWGQQYK